MLVGKSHRDSLTGGGRERDGTGARTPFGAGLRFRSRVDAAAERLASNANRSRGGRGLLLFAAAVPAGDVAELRTQLSGALRRLRKIVAPTSVWSLRTNASSAPERPRGGGDDRPLTGLLNRRAAQDAFGREAATAAREHSTLCLALVSTTSRTTTTPTGISRETSCWSRWSRAHSSARRSGARTSRATRARARTARPTPVEQCPEDGPRIEGRKAHIQSIEPSRATSAAVRLLPITA